MPVKADQQEKQTEPAELDSTFNLHHHHPMNKHVSYTFGLLMGLGVIVLFLGVVSLAPQLGKKFGSLSTKKQTQESKATDRTSPCIAENTESKAYGDVDGDGDVDSGDVRKIGMGGLTTDEERRADVDVDGDADVIDGLFILKYLEYEIVTFKACADSDGDGFANWVEDYLGTYKYESCGFQDSNGRSQAWPADLSNAIAANKINISDASAYIGIPKIYGTSPGDAGWNQRFDLVPGVGAVPGAWINISDLQMVTTGTAPMFGNQKMFGNVACNPNNPSATTTLIADKTTVAPNESFTLTWNSTNARLCEPTGSWGSAGNTFYGTNGARGLTAGDAGNYTYSMTCAGMGGEQTRSVTVTVPPCTGNPTLTLSTTSVEVGDSVRATASGVSNCTGADKIDLMIWQDGKWVYINYCSLTANNSCYIDFYANYSSGQTIAFLDAGSNGTYESSSNQEFLTINTPPPPVVNEPRGWPAIGNVGDLGVHHTTFGDYMTWEAVDILPYFNDTNVYATMDGTIKKYSSSSCSGEAAVDIENASSGYKVHYCHLINITVSHGDTVARGQLLGNMSNTGDTDGSGAVQVHYAISPNASLDPPYVPFRPSAGNIINNLNDSDPS